MKVCHDSCVLLQSSATRQDLDDVALPMLVVYKSGEVEHCFARVHEEFSDTFTVADVEWLLENKGVFQLADGGEKETKVPVRGLHMARYDHAAGDRDDDDNDDI